MQKSAEDIALNSQIEDLKSFLRAKDLRFYSVLLEATAVVTAFDVAITLSTMRRRARASGLFPTGAKPLRIAVVGGASLRPFADLLEHFTATLAGFEVLLWIGDYDNYIFEIVDEDSELYQFNPEVVLILPSEARCRFTGTFVDPLEIQREQADTVVDDLLELCKTVHDKSGAEIVLGNFRLPPSFDPGSARFTSLSSDYAFRKYVNLQLGFRSPSFVQICDIEFLANRLGTQKAIDDRTWFESKQPFSMDLAVLVAREFAQIVKSMRQAAKKVVVLDLDNTLWGGVVGDDGLEGIEVGTTSPRGEAYRHFQQYLLSLTERGVLLAVCSKNDHDKAVEPFLKLPEMVLRLSDIVNFKANWEPKSENIRQIATELNLGLDSFVFVDDNPAEIDIVKQFVPEVTCIWVGDDPSFFASMLQDSRLFEFRSVTKEDLGRVDLYRQEAKRQELQSTATDMGAYLSSLQMVADVSSFASIDCPRIAQLINKSNQFNLTTRRRTEAEVHDIASSPDKSAFIVRLQDRFGDHGLIAVVIGQVAGKDFIVDTWLMSCRVLKRQVEEITMNEIVRRAKENGCDRVVGVYRPTAKNGMVKELYPRFGFATIESSNDETRFGLDIDAYNEIETKIRIQEVTHGTK